jgi:peptide/nickel transport system permease protein
MRLRLGAALVAGIVIFCVAGPLVRSAPPRDPRHASLVPPLTEVTVLAFDDGSFIVAPSIRIDGHQGVAAGAGRTSTFDPSRIVDRSSYRYWLGSDRFGADVLRDLMTGGRISIGIAALSLLIAIIVGSTTGMAAATGGKVVDTIVMRCVDALLAFPVLFLMILVSALVRPDPALLVLLLGLTSWMGVARLVRGQILSLKTRPFVAAATTSGSPWHRIATWHYAPNLVGPVSQDAALRLGDLVLAEATLSFLGLGVSPSVATWGSMVAQGQRFMPDGWWLVILPGLAIASLVIGFALIGDGLQQRGEPTI